MFMFIVALLFCSLGAYYAREEIGISKVLDLPNMIEEYPDLEAPFILERSEKKTETPHFLKRLGKRIFKYDYQNIDCTEFATYS